jgi:hypothetical protein
LESGGEGTKGGADTDPSRMIGDVIVIDFFIVVGFF